MAGEQELGEVERAARDVLDELARPAPEPQSVIEAGAALAGSVGKLVRVARRTRDKLEVLDPCREALAAVTAVMSEAEEVMSEAPALEGALAAIDLDQDLMDLVALVGRLEIAERLHGLPVRQAASATGLALSYVSDLSRGNKGLPSLDKARRLDDFLSGRPPPAGPPESVAGIVERTKAELERLKAVRRDRQAPVSARNQPSTSPRLELRVQAVSDAALRDDSLLTLVERLMRLEPRERRAVGRLVEDLAEG
jgi:transcriptional regulator with XRE-family HTH domain